MAAAPRPPLLRNCYRNYARSFSSSRRPSFLPLALTHAQTARTATTVSGSGRNPIVAAADATAHKKPGMNKFSHCVSKTFDFCFLTLGP